MDIVCCSIDDNVQKKTLKAISRARWPTGAVDSVGKPRTQFFDDEFYKGVLEEFEVVNSPTHTHVYKYFMLNLLVFTSVSLVFS